MPHDANGNLLQVGNIVNVPCKITEIHQTEEYCNLILETQFKMFPSENRSNISLNARQVQKK